jgi:hypothetical protein
VKEISFMNSPRVYIEITQTVLRALKENDGVELPLERDAKGKLTVACKTKLVLQLSEFVNRKSWLPRPRAFCAIGANGVSLRKISLPNSAKDDFQKLLLLQIESEFPLPPDELAWGWRQIGPNGSVSKRDVLVAAVKKEVVEEYAGVLASCGLNPVFTLAGLARNYLCPEPRGSHAILEIGRTQSELTTFENGEPIALRVLSPAAESVAKSLGTKWNGNKIFVFAVENEIANFNLPGCEPVKIESGAGRSSATLGLKKSIEQNGGALSLVLQVKAKSVAGKLDFSQPDVKKWLKRAAILLVVLLALPFAEALVLKPFLSRRLAKLNAEKARLATIDHELEFLQFLKQSQPPYLDALYVFAKSSPPNAKIESVTMNRRGEISLRGSMQNGQAVTDFRSKLIASGFFSSVAVEEQAPTPDRQKVNVRMTILWKPAADRARLAIGPSSQEIESANTNKLAQAGGGGFPGMMPMGMPPGMPMPMPRPSRR